MKNILPLLFGVALLPIAAHATSTSNTVGYTTETILAGQFSLFAPTLHNPVVIGGDIDAVDASSITDSAAGLDFTSPTVLGASGSATYILEIVDNTGAGLIQEITSWTANVLTTPQDTTAFGVAIGDQYQLRKATSLGELFGPNNEEGLTEGTTGTADIVWVSTGGGSFNRYYYATAAPPFVTEGWKLIGGGDTDRANDPIVYTDGIIVESRAVADLDVVITGEVKPQDTKLAIVGPGFNHIGTVYPVGSTLGSSGLGSFVQTGTTTTADIVWMPNGTGGYNRYYFADAAPPFVTAGWKLIGGGDTDRAGDPLTSGIILERRGASGNLDLTPPTSYSSL